MYKDKRIAVVVPAYNEAPSIGKVVSELVDLHHAGQPLLDHVVVCDNASSDDTAELASLAGAQVEYEPLPGYGRACLRAMAALPPCDIVVFVDGDYSAHTDEIPKLLDACIAGAELVIGARHAQLREAGALTPHQILGNQFAAWLLQRTWHQQVTDLGPLRAVQWQALCELNMAEPTFGWTMEMQAKAMAMGMQVAEVPVHTRCRIGVSKVSGTVRGSLGATWGILSTFAKIAWQLPGPAFSRQ
ncbi:MAG: glycosyltransferase family 2 protein [Pseudomonadota bacterium]